VTLHEENTIINKYWHITWNARGGWSQTWFPGRLGILLQRRIMLRSHFDSLRLCLCLQLLFCTNFLELLSAPLLTAMMEEEFSKLPLPPIILTQSKLFLKKSKWLCFRNTSSHRYLDYSLAPIWTFNFLTGNLNILLCGPIKNKQRKMACTALCIVSSLLPPSPWPSPPSPCQQMQYDLVRSAQLAKASALPQEVWLDSFSTVGFALKHWIPSRQRMWHTEPHV